MLYMIIKLRPSTTLRVWNVKNRRCFAMKTQMHTVYSTKEKSFCYSFISRRNRYEKVRRIDMKERKKTVLHLQEM